MQKLYYINLGTEKLHYRLFGIGKKLLITFHGYGLDGDSFLLLYPFLANEYSIISVDLPHHGKSVWGNTPFTKHCLEKFIKQVMNEYIVDKISILGYSLGGRVCLTLIACMAQYLDKVILVAPDGLIFNMPYYLATSNLVGKKLFKYIIKKPAGFFKVADILLKRRVIDASRHKFVTQYLATSTSREFLLKVWTCMTEIVANLKIVKSIINEFEIPVIIFMGEFDRIIPPVNAKKFINGMDNVQLHILQKGHRILDNTSAQRIAESLL